jgi:hypothetical protein
MKRVAALGAAAAVVYIAAVAATSVISERDVRPLFDAGAPPPPYRWVKPPPDFAPGNVKPQSTEVSFGLGPDAVPAAGASEDSQFVFNLNKGAIAPHDPDQNGVARIDPLNPDKLGPLPPKQFADGNAYRIALRYDPSGAPAAVTIPGSVLLTVPVPAEAVIYSTDGKAWQTVKSSHASATTIGAEMPGGGYYLAVTSEALGTTGGGGAGRLVVPVLITVLVAAALVGAPVLVRRRRPPPSRQARRQANRTQRR